ncbi:VOC family protein [Novosphingobium sp.]|uniref:VOC family protein n=1 Tax=Novosphingobium sp. TaxID=1874826 RepID=UPI002B4905A7|nr:VOC family protein [Novosphingobium sp.]HKR91783.1 VOC family protein [Novosphingobium sp.]
MSRPYISLITLGVADVARARIFYRDGFGWKPVFETEEVVFFQMNGLVFTLWDKAQLEADMERPCPAAGSFALAHNVESISRRPSGRTTGGVRCAAFACA